MPGSARQGGDAECAAVVAAVLNLDEQARALPQTWERSAFDWFLFENLRGDLKQVRYKPVLDLIGHHSRDIREQRSRFRLQCGPASGGDDPGISLSLDPANRLARVSRRRSRHRAGIDNRQVSLRRFGDQSVPGAAELSGILFDLCLI